jgi:hypothetical protein
MRARDLLLSTTMLGGTLVVAPVMGADMSVPAPPPAAAPAVDGPNVKVAGLGGTFANRSLSGVVGAYTFPLANQYGVQIDGGVGRFDSSAWTEIGGHLFWRNPSQALFGIYGSFTQWDRFGGVDVAHVAGEGELYLGRYTLGGIVGIEFGNSVSSSTVGFVQTPIPGPGVINAFTTNSQGFAVKTRFMDQINLKYYFNDYFDGYVGHRYVGGKNAAAFGSELSSPLGRGVLGSLFVEARAGEGAYHGVWGGVKLYFGADKPLIARHRQQDPGGTLNTYDNVTAFTNNTTSSTANLFQIKCTTFLRSDGRCETGS